MSRLSIFKLLFLIAFLALVNHTSVTFGQANVAWTGSGDGSTFSDDNNWFATEAGGSGVAGPEFVFTTDSLKFDTAGTTINNDLDPASNGGAALQLGLGFGGTEGTSAAFHFLAGSGDFTFDGFGVTAGDSGQSGIFRAEVGAGALQTFNIPMTLTGGQKRRQVVLNNNGTVVFNGDINFTNSIMFINEGAGRVELNGNNTGVGPGHINTGAGTNQSRTSVRNNVAGTVLSLGSDTALGDAGTGTWDAGDLQMRGVTAVGVLTVDTNAPRDLSGYMFNVSNSSGGGGLEFVSPHDVSVGYLMRTGSGGQTRTITNEGSGVLTVEGGIFATNGATAASRGLGVFATGTGGTDGKIVVNGRLFNTMVDPISAANYDVNNDGSLFEDNSSRGGINATSQFLGGDGTTFINGNISFRNGAIELNGDSSTSWIGSQVAVQSNGIVTVGHDNAFGDSTSLIALFNTGVVDIGTHSIEQRVVGAGGRLRGNGTLTNESDWSLATTLQPGGEAPTTADVLTFDFSNAAVGNTLQFEAGSTIDLVLDGGLSSSTIDVLGPSLGGTTDIVFDANTFSFTDLSGGSLTEGVYTLIDGDANTSISLAGSPTLTGIDAFPGSTLSVSGDDLVLNLSSAGGGDADFDSDGDVDGDDFLAWQTNVGFSAPVDLQPFGDANGDDAIDGLDLVVWELQYGSTPALSAASAVPEPGTLVVLAMGCVVMMGIRRAA